MDDFVQQMLAAPKQSLDGSIGRTVALTNGYTQDEGDEAEAMIVSQYGNKAAQEGSLILNYLIQNFGHRS